MKNSKWLTGLMMIAGIFVSGSAMADHFHGGHGGPHVGLGFYFGAPYPYPYYASPYYYPYPYAPYPQVITVPAPQPPVYIEQGSAQSTPQPSAAPQANNFWYHCDNPNGYYPYIKECPGGWQQVSPTPPPPQQ